MDEYTIADVDELLYCPVCGDELIVTVVRGVIKKVCSIYKSEHGGFFVEYHPDKESTVTMWNTFAGE